MWRRWRGCGRAERGGACLWRRRCRFGDNAGAFLARGRAANELPRQWRRRGRDAYHRFGLIGQVYPVGHAIPAASRRPLGLHDDQRSRGSECRCVQPARRRQRICAVREHAHAALQLHLLPCIRCAARHALGARRANPDRSRLRQQWTAHDELHVHWPFLREELSADGGRIRLELEHVRAELGQREHFRLRDLAAPGAADPTGASGCSDGVGGVGVARNRLVRRPG